MKLYHTVYPSIELHQICLIHHMYYNLQNTCLFGQLDPLKPMILAKVKYHILSK